MKIVTRYEANDGREFATAHQAERHDTMLAAVEIVKSYLPKEPPFGSGFMNGVVYVQCTAEQVEQAKREFTNLYNITYNQSISSFGQVNGRMLDDGGSLLYQLWGKLTCIDEQNRWWGQPYYRNHPDQDAPEYKQS